MGYGCTCCRAMRQAKWREQAFDTMARFLLRFVGFAFTAGTVVFIVVAAVAGVFISKYSQDLPDYSQLKNYEPPVMTRVHAGDGASWPNTTRNGGSSCRSRPCRSWSSRPSCRPRTRTSIGILASIRKASRAPGVTTSRRRRASGRQSGASTITQQVAKNFLLTNERTFERKIKEMLLAHPHRDRPTPRTRSSSSTSTRSISALGNYGVAAASLNYFGKSVHELTIARGRLSRGAAQGPRGTTSFQASATRDRASQLGHRAHGRQRLYRRRRTARRREAAARRVSALAVAAILPPASSPKRCAARSPSATASKSSRGRPLGAHHA